MIGRTKGPCISARANQKGSRPLKQKFHAYQAATNVWIFDQIRLPFAVPHLLFDDFSRKVFAPDDACLTVCYVSQGAPRSHH